MEPHSTGLEIAVIGMEGRFPGANNVREFWENLKQGVESISLFTDEELSKAGVDAGLLANPNYVKADRILDGIEYFDAGFFGYTPKEAEVMDPQIRIFHECSWAALEDAGYDPFSYDGLIGVYAGAAPNLNWEARTILTGKNSEIGYFAAMQLSKKDYLALRVSYKLNLMGPSFVLYTACSTSLVAIHLACQAILNGECEMALAGGVTVLRLKKTGYIYQEGMIDSADGHCRTFDANASGIIGGDGAAVVLLKRLEDALADRDHIYALVKGSAINNDGTRKAGFTAPSAEGQAEVIKMALQVAEVQPESIGYVEAHGTATELGDPVEIAGLKMAFNTGKTGFCGLGSVKTNVGHLDAAAGVTGFIKTVMILRNQVIPPSINFEIPNPQIDLIGSPFFVNAALVNWEPGQYPRRAGVSSFGIGGTNAHVVLEEAALPPDTAENKTGRTDQLILLSAKTRAALDTMTGNLAAFLEQNPSLNLADVAFTLQAGRSAFKYRKMFVCAGVAEAVELLTSADSPQVRSFVMQEENRPLVFYFPGEQQDQEAREALIRLAAELYRSEPVLQKETVHCFEVLQRLQGKGNEMRLWFEGFPGSSQSKAMAAGEISPTLMFILQYALARLLMHWGINAYTMMGEGSGQVTADCLTGKYGLEEALRNIISGQGFNSAGAVDMFKEMSSLKDAIVVHFGAGKNPGNRENQDLPVSHPLNTDPNSHFVNLVNPSGHGRSARFHLFHLWQVLGALWLYGVKMDWQRFHAANPARRIPLPTYPFQRQRYWIDEDPFAAGVVMLKGNKDSRFRKEPDIADWLYRPSWKQCRVEPGLWETGDSPINRRWLVFADESFLCSGLIKQLAARNQQVITVLAGARFGQSDEEPGEPDKQQGRVYTIDPRESRHYDELFKHLRDNEGLPDKILHLWTFGSLRETNDLDPDITGETFDKAQWLGFYSLMFIAKTIGKQKVSKDIDIAVLTGHVHDITGAEPLSPEKAPVLTLLKAIPQEYPGISCRSIDVAPLNPLDPLDPDSGKEEGLIHSLLEELSFPPKDPVVAYRNNRRWVPFYEPLHLGKNLEEKAGFREQGVYLVTGGLGEIGLMFSQLLVQASRARLILTGRSPFPGPDQWEKWLANHEKSDPTSIKINRLRQLEEMGGKILYLQADVADTRQMKAVAEQARQTFGEINGVVHAAGIISGQSMRSIRELSVRDCQLQFQAKVYGLLALHELFKDRHLDFFWVMSSISCVLAGLGFGAYASANMFMDVFVKKYNQQHGCRWLTLNWDGMGADLSITLFKRIFALQHTDQVVASVGGNLQERIDRWVKLEQVRKIESPLPDEKKVVGHPRPELSTPYVAPRNPVEEAIANIWKGLLGFAEIGIHDDFLELGGDSLKSITIISRIHQQMNVNVPMTEFFVNSTIAGIANYIAANEEKDTYVSIEPAEEKEFYPASSAQKRLYTLQQMVPDSGSYNMSYMFEVEQGTDKDRLEEAFKCLIQRHESLRTSFRMLYDEPVQIIHPDVTFEIDVFTLAPDNPAETRALVTASINTFIRPFDLSRAPLLRVGIIKTGTSDILMVVMHHIVSDGISLDIFVRDFMQLYMYPQQNLPALRLQYKDFSQWQVLEIKSGVIKKQEEYWVGEFSKEVPILNIPCDYSRPAVQSFAGKTIGFGLSREEKEALDEMARTHKVTLFMLLLAVYYTFLSKISGQEDIVVGTPVVGRRHPDLNPIMGIFVNTLALRNHPYSYESFAAFLDKVKEKSLQAFENQDYQFEDLVEKVNLTRDMSRNPLFDAVFDLNYTLEAAAEMSQEQTRDRGLSLKSYSFEQTTAKFDLTLLVFDFKERLEFVFEYCTRLFAEETIQRFGRYVQKIISQVIENPRRNISQIEIISAQEKNRILYDFNHTATDYPKDRTIPHIFREQVEKNPDRIAVIGARTGESGKPGKPGKHDVHLSYRCLDRDAANLADRLMENGIGPDDMVGIIAERSVDMMVGILGILKSGGAYLPIEPDFPRERIEYMLADSNARILVATAKFQGQDNDGPEKTNLALRLPVHIHTIKIETNCPVEPGPGSLNFTLDTISTSGSPGNSANLAYVIYTSGTTGKPKGTLTNHYNVTRVVKHTNYLEINENDRVLQLSNYAFDGSVFDIYGALLNSAGLVLLEKEQVIAVDHLADRIKNEAVTLFFLTTALFNTLVELRLDCLENIRKILFGGERVSVEHTRKALKHLGSDKIIHVYGPTETTVYATYYFIRQVSEDDVTVPIGKALANTTVYILDKSLKPVPIGINGEIFVGGDGVARGYLNCPEMTAEKFRLQQPGGLVCKNRPLDPPLNVLSDQQIPGAQDSRTTVSAADCQSLYVTGDLARWLPDGNIQFLGRIDYQVKIRGFRIELGEIEKLLAVLPQIKDVVVIDRCDASGDKYLCAYVVYHGQDLPKSSPAQELKEYLARSLPDYMIPAYFVLMDSLPLNPNGKIDRNLLPEPEIKAGEDYVAPKNETQEKLVEIWSEVLAIDKKAISMQANFFQLGGHSLKATLMTAKIHRKLQVKLPLVDVFQTPTIKELSRVINDLRVSRYVSIEPIEKREYYELSSAQKRMFVAQQMDVQGRSYNMPNIMVVKAKPDREFLKNTFRLLIERHESLRTSFHLVHRTPVQVVHDEVTLDIRSFQKEEKDIQEIIENFVSAFDLGTAPLLRVGLITAPGTDQRQYVLMVDMHHIISDGSSHKALLADFMTLAAGDRPRPLKIQYKDFSHWQNLLYRTGQIKKQETYWLDHFQDRTAGTGLPTDYPRPAVRDISRGDFITFNLDPQLGKAVMAAVKETGTTSYILLLAAYVMLLAKFTRKEDIVVGTLLSGRSHADLEHVIGMFVNTLPIRNYPGKEKTVYEFLQEVKENVLNASENQDYQFEELVAALGLQGDTSRNPLFDTVFTQDTVDIGDSVNPGHTKKSTQDTSGAVEPYGFSVKFAKFDLYVQSTVVNEAINILIRYSTQLFKRSRIEKLAQYYTEILEQAAGNINMKLKDITLSHDLLTSTSTVHKDDGGDFNF